MTQAAATDPILHNLLTLAQRNQLTEEQRSTLATFVRSLNERLGSESSVGLPTSATPSPPPRPFDLVIEFHERSSDRWLVPRGAVYLEDTYESTGGSQYDVIVTINLPLSQSAPASHEDDPMGETKQTTVPTQAVKLQWKGLHQDSYDLLMTWAEGKPSRPDNVSVRRLVCNLLCSGLNIVMVEYCETDLFGASITRWGTHRCVTSGMRNFVLFQVVMF